MITLLLSISLILSSVFLSSPSVSLISIFKYLHLQQTKPPTHNSPWTLWPLPATNLLSLVSLSHPSFLKQKFSIPKKTNTSLSFVRYSVSLA